MDITDIPSLRSKLNSIHSRKAVALQAVQTILEIKAVYTQEMLELACDGIQHWNNYEETREKWEEFVGTEVRVVDAEFLTGITGETHIGNNTEYQFAELVKLLTSNVKPLIGTEEVPSREGWLDEELEIIFDSYRNRIMNHNLHLRDAHTCWKRLINQTEPMPHFVKSKCLGMFGQPDFRTRHVYNEGNFVSRYVYDKSIRNHVAVLSAKFMAPIIGEQKADLLEESMVLIGERVHPLPGEPKTLDSISSHTSNRIPFESIK